MIRRRMQICPGNSIDHVHGHPRKSIGKGGFITVPGRDESSAKVVRGGCGGECCDVCGLHWDTDVDDTEDEGENEDGKTRR